MVKIKKYGLGNSKDSTIRFKFTFRSVLNFVKKCTHSYTEAMSFVSEFTYDKTRILICEE